jgi:alpha-amylase/alpha-mannosidase (GH57 family)
MERFLCIHGHFYQPPRENPWLEAIEIQDSAHPYHDWNERVTAECYAPNTASRTLDGAGRIREIISNYSRISFNFGPTLLSWMEEYAPEYYQAILDADRQSLEWRSGHGNAIAQVYNHIIMPLADRRDKRTQVLWGIRDFERRFKRFPEGMWLGETAVDLETLEVLAEAGIAYTILAPHQAWRMRKLGAGKWTDVTGARIDPSLPYLCRLPSGREITLFFYDGPISQAVAFEKLLESGERFVQRLMGGFSEQRHGPQLLSIATDGETYGHHHTFGEMALGYALTSIEKSGLAKLTNYGEFLALNPPVHEAQIYENTSWSCCHGIERWRSNCGCNSGGQSGWNQEWRGPLRAALDWLRDELAERFAKRGREYLKDPWGARDAYIDVILDRSSGNVAAFLAREAARELGEEEKVAVLSLLEMQRHLLLMYTSCGWFFDDLAGIETVQVIQYAGRAIQLAEELFHVGFEKDFRERVGAARSNLPERGDGATIYEQSVKPAMVDPIRVGAHYGISSLFEEYADETAVFSYRAIREDFRILQAVQTKLAIGRIMVRSAITGEAERVSFCALHFGGHVLNAGVSPFRDNESYATMKEGMINAFRGSDFAGIIRLMDAHFGMHTYSLKDLFRDEQRKILDRIIGSIRGEFASTYHDLYENNQILMKFLREAGIPVPRRFLATAETALNIELQKVLAAEVAEVERIRDIIAAANYWQVKLDAVDLEFLIRRRIERTMRALIGNPADADSLFEVLRLLEIAALLPITVNLWQTQNIYHTVALTSYPAFLAGGREGDGNALRWVEGFKNLGRLLHFNIGAVLPDQARG